MRKTHRKHPRGYNGTEVTTRRFGDVIPSVLSSIQKSHQERHDLILAAWPQVVGAKIAKFTRPESFIDGTLKIRVNNSTVHSLLNKSEKEKLLLVLRKKFPKVEIQDILFRMG